MTRRRLTTADRVRIFDSAHGICHMCQTRIHVGEAWEVSHPIPLELGGADDATNWQPAHKKCHAKRTAEVDMPDIAKAKRRRAKHLGIRKPSRMLGSRNSPLKRKLNGEIVRR